MFAGRGNVQGIVHEGKCPGKYIFYRVKSGSEKT